MRVEIARLQERLQTTMIYVTHDQVEAMTLAIESSFSTSDIRRRSPLWKHAVCYNGTPPAALTPQSGTAIHPCVTTETASIVHYGGRQSSTHPVRERFRLSTGDLFGRQDAVPSQLSPVARFRPVPFLFKPCLAGFGIQVVRLRLWITRLPVRA